MEYTWKNLVAYTIWQCKICHETMDDKDSISNHLLDKHNLKIIEVFDNDAYSPEFEYPNIK